MKRITSILLIFTIMFSATTVAFADWNANYGTEPSESFTTYPYRVLYLDLDNVYYYVASSQKLKVVQHTNGWRAFDVESTPVQFKVYKIRMDNGVPVWDLKGTSWGGAFLNDYDVRYANQDIIVSLYTNPSETRLIYKNTTGSTTPPTSGPVTFLLPNNNFADNTSTMVFLTKYTMALPANADKNKLKIEITGGVAGSGETLSHDFKTVNGKWEGLLKFTRQLYPGDNAITFTLKYDGAVVGSATVNVKYYDDFIDTDGDGIEDRTGQTEVPDDWELPIEDNTPDGSILGYIKWAFENITYIFDGVVGLVEGLFKMTGKMSTIMGEYMSFLPKPINTVLIIGCMAVVVLKIFGR